MCRGNACEYVLIAYMSCACLCACVVCSHVNLLSVICLD